MERRNASELDLGTVDQNKIQPPTQYGFQNFQPVSSVALFSRCGIHGEISPACAQWYFSYLAFNQPSPPTFFLNADNASFCSGGLRIVRLVMSAATYHSENSKLKVCLPSWHDAPNTSLYSWHVERLYIGHQTSFVLLSLILNVESG